MGNITSSCMESNHSNQFDDDTRFNKKTDSSPALRLQPAFEEKVEEKPVKVSVAEEEKPVAENSKEESRRNKFVEQTAYNEWFKKTNGDLTVPGNRPDGQIRYSNMEAATYTGRAEIEKQPENRFQ